MDIKCELFNYENENCFANKKVVVRNDVSDNDRVIIEVGEERVKVYGNEMAEAINRCMRSSYPYV